MSAFAFIKTLITMQNAQIQTPKNHLGLKQEGSLSSLRKYEGRGLRGLAFATGLSLFLIGCGGNSVGMDAGGNGNTGGVDAGAGSDATNPQGLGWQGRWSSTQGIPSQTAIVVPSTTDKTATVWLLANDASSLSRLQAKADLTLSGKRYTLGTAAANGAELSGQYTVNQATTPSTLVLNLNSITPHPLPLSQSDMLAGQASTVDAAGRWLAKSGGVDTTWVLAAQGDSLTIEGSSTTGCTWLGTGNAPATVKAYDIAVTEVCNGISTAFSGIATLNADKNRFTVVATTTNETHAMTLFFGKL